jgi:hypothetical protein
VGGEILIADVYWMWDELDQTYWPTEGSCEDLS